MIKAIKDFLLALIAILMFVPVMMLWLIMLSILALAERRPLSITDY